MYVNLNYLATVLEMCEACLSVLIGISFQYNSNTHRITHTRSRPVVRSKDNVGDYANPHEPILSCQYREIALLDNTYVV